MHVNSLLTTHNISNLEELSALAHDLAAELQSGDVVLLSGDLGAGKTTFTQFLGKALGVKDIITSPTYTLVGEYSAINNLTIATLVHIDLYRTGDAVPSQPLPLNNDYIRELLASSKQQNAVVVIEWAELLSDKLSNRIWNINIKPGVSEGERLVTVTFDKSIR